LPPIERTTTSHYLTIVTIVKIEEHPLEEWIDCEARSLFEGMKSPAKMKQARIEAIESSLVEDRRLQRFLPRLKEMQRSLRRTIMSPRRNLSCMVVSATFAFR
jgi:hypothetical protein